MENRTDFAEIKAAYPDEWVLLGDPVFDDATLQVLSGIPLCHSKDIREVCYLRCEKAEPYETITLMYTGKPKPGRVLIGPLRRIQR